jgi:SPP1 gp7 family putative phage head morphogenesis protein
MRERLVLPGSEAGKIKRTVKGMLRKARELGVEHIEQELGLQPRTYAKKSLFPTMDADLDRYETEKAFWITGIVKESILNAARGYIFNWAKEHPQENVAGDGFEEGLYELLKEWIPAVDASGHTINQAARSEVIARTNIMDMYNHARLTMMQRPELKAWVQAYRYTAILDSVTTPLCRSLHGKIFTDETLNGYVPPNHYNALAEGTLIRTREGMAPIEGVSPGMEVWTHRKRWRKVYAQMGKPSDNGRIRELLLSSGGILRITDEHPVLTALPRGGWKSAGDLQVGDVLFEYSENMAGVQNHLSVNPEDFPSLFDEPGSTWPIMRLSPSAPVVLPVDFKGDLAGEECKVQHVSPDGMLENKIIPAREKQTIHNGLVEFGFPLERGCTADGTYLRDSLHAHGVLVLHPDGVGGMNGARFLSQTPCPVGLPSGFVRVESAIRDGRLFYAGPDGDVVSLAPVGKDGFSDSEITLDSANRFLSDSVLLLNKSLDGGTVAQVDHDSSSGWVPTAIISIVDEEYKGNVWNLAVEEDETYLAENVIVHNCRSMLLPVTLLDRGWQAEMGGQGQITGTPQEGFATGVRKPPAVREAAIGKQ